MNLEREKSKMQEKYQTILSQMLKDEDNKYCVDCDAKSKERTVDRMSRLPCRSDPRWASWNIGVFICIRCAGFHRNLGVHISKVKSVNLDSWTAEQLAVRMSIGPCLASQSLRRRRFKQWVIAVRALSTKPICPTDFDGRKRTRTNTDH